ncbi:BIRC2 [Branchiostoma lanceolatum]|uniref:BIRC2 protein n=1 Tax=Branchiostoma lanceolatum TaxID=7740 RepID=A0A8J9ZZK5_BRALA|nr:BIRC2 [Branchiostoma lanceolatum]
MSHVMGSTYYPGPPQSLSRHTQSRTLYRQKCSMQSKVKMTPRGNQSRCLHIGEMSYWIGSTKPPGTPQSWSSPIVGAKGEGARDVFKDVLKEVSPHAAEIIQGRASAQLYKEEKDPLEKNRPELVYTLKHVEPILDRLLSSGSLSDQECNRIRAKETPEDKARELLDIVATKDKGARDVFKEVLEEVNPNAADLV